MRFLLLATAAMSAQELRRVDDASSGGAVVAIDGSADDGRPLWADGRLAVAVAAADGSLIELARPPETTTLALTTARDDQPFVDVAVVAAARPTTRDAAVLAVARVAVPAACFTLQNNILYVALSNLDPLLFQISYQIKTLLTALLSVRMLGRSLSRWQWASQLLLMAGIKLADVLVPHSELQQNAYIIEVPEGGSDAAAAPADKGPEPVLALLASADAAAGEKLAKKCTACHVFDPGGGNKVGPALWNIVNADKGAVDGFSYSNALVEHGGAWDYVALNLFLAKPKAYISGTKMNFAGLKKPQDRANMIAYLRQQADAPAALPTDTEIAAESGS